LSGTNAHVVLADAPPSAPLPRAAGPRVLLVSARTPAALAALVARYAALLAQQPALDLDDLCYTAAVGRAHFAVRAAFAAPDAASVAARLVARGVEARVAAADALGDAATVVAVYGAGYGADYGADYGDGDPVTQCQALAALLRAAGPGRRVVAVAVGGGLAAA